jgi:hypothetical protein
MHFTAPRIARLPVRKLLLHAAPIKDLKATKGKSPSRAAPIKDPKIIRGKAPSRAAWALKSGVRKVPSRASSPPRSRNAAKVFLQTMTECFEFAEQQCLPAGRYTEVECSIKLYKPQRGAWPFTKDGARTRVYSAKNLFGGDSRFAVKFDPMENVRQWGRLGNAEISRWSLEIQQRAYRVIWITGYKGIE